MKKIFLFSFLVVGFFWGGDIFCMSHLDKIKSATEKDLVKIRIITPVEALTEIKKMDELLQSSTESSDSSEEEILEYIAPVCAQYRNKAEVVAFENIPGVDHEHMREYQVAISNYYVLCADAMSRLIEALFTRKANTE